MIEDFLCDNKKILTRLLSASIRGRPFLLPIKADVNWQFVSDDAVRHQVMPLIYPLLNEIGERMGTPDAVIKVWRKNALYEGMKQERNYIGIGKILEKFSVESIPVIALKGLVLRELYPHPSLRTMGDIDLLVKPDDMDKAGKVLTEAGYTICSEEELHCIYYHKTLPYIELHRSIIRGAYFGGDSDFETDIWKRAVRVQVSKASVFSLCPQDNVLYLSMHMASHIIKSGFGLRQLCDFVLFVEKFRSEIDWNEFFNKTELFHIDTFLEVLLKACETMFCLEPPKSYRKYEPPDDSLVRSFIEDIFDGGVFGMNSTERITANRLLYYNGRIRNLLFPKVEKLDTRFNYAKNHSFLLPVAWIHRIFYCIIRKDIDLTEKTAVLSLKEPAEICRNRSILLRRLRLID